MSMTEHIFLAWAIKEGTGKLLTWRTLRTVVEDQTFGSTWNKPDLPTSMKQSTEM